MEKLIDKIHEGGRYILIKGKSGSGKSFTLKQLESELSKDQYQIIIFDGDYQYDDREYYPFKKALFTSVISSSPRADGLTAFAIAETPFG